MNNDNNNNSNCGDVSAAFDDVDAVKHFKQVELADADILNALVAYERRDAQKIIEEAGLLMALKKPVNRSDFSDCDMFGVSIDDVDKDDDCDYHDLAFPQTDKDDENIFCRMVELVSVVNSKTSTHADIDDVLRPFQEKKKNLKNWARKCFFTPKKVHHRLNRLGIVSRLDNEKKNNIERAVLGFHGNDNKIYIGIDYPVLTVLFNKKWFHAKFAAEKLNFINYSKKHMNPNH